MPDTTEPRIEGHRSRCGEDCGSCARRAACVFAPDFLLAREEEARAGRRRREAETG